MQIPLSTFDDFIAESTEMFGAELSSPSEGVILGDQPLSTVHILDDESKECLVLYLIEHKICVCG